MIVSSIRLRNSGRNAVFKTSWISRRIRDSSPLPASSAMIWLPRLDVMMIDGVAEVDRAALAVGQPAVVEDLEQDVEDVAMGLFDLVEEHDRIRPPPDRLGEPAPFFITDIARGCTDQAGDVVPLAELAHVESDHRRFAVEEELGQGLGQLGLADAGRSQKQKRADRPVGVLQAGPAAPDGVGDRVDGRVLIDQPQVDLIFELQQLFALGREHARDRNAGPLADDLGDLLGIDLLLEQPAGLLGLAVALRLGLGDPFLESLSLGVERGQRLELASSGRSPRCCMWRISSQARLYSTLTASSRSRTF